MEAEGGRSLNRISFPVYRGNWKIFVKDCLAEAHTAGVNEAILVAAKAQTKQWEWPFAPDPRQEIILLSSVSGILWVRSSGVAPLRLCRATGTYDFP